MSFWQKKERRLATLKTMPWSKAKKETIARALTLEYTSSDESNLSEDENEVVQLTGYLVKKLSRSIYQAETRPSIPESSLAKTAGHRS